MKHPAIIVLEALLNGQEINTPENTYVMSEDNQFGVKVFDNDHDPCVMVTDYSINWLMKFAEKQDPKFIATLAANNALIKQ